MSQAVTLSQPVAYLGSAHPANSTTMFCKMLGEMLFQIPDHLKQKRNLYKQINVLVSCQRGQSHLVKDAT